MQAVCGAIEQVRRRLADDGPVPKAFLAGGAAADIAPYLTEPVEVVDNLVLEGVLALAESSPRG
jgi:type III pantothenate kinase